MTPEQLNLILSNPDHRLNNEERLALIRQTKSEWCKEQRENCLKAWEKAPCDEFEGMAILNAPEP